jgi:tetratricopeptide (TPR) repeat protein
MQPISILNSTHSFWKYLFYVISAATFIIMPICSLSHGMSGDEWTLIIYGNDIYNYFFNGSKVALDYDIQNFNQVKGLHYYGGLYDFVVTFLHRTFFSSVQELTFRHIFNSLFGAGLFLFTGLIAKQIGGWRVAVLAFLMIVISPRLFGESMNNPKDIPFAFANAFFIYYLLKYTASINELQKASWKYALLMGLGFGMALGFRIGGFILIPLLLLYVFLIFISNVDFKQYVIKNIKPLSIQLIALIALGYIIGIIFWPWALQAPLSRPFEALTEMTNRAIPIRMLYDGEYIMNTKVPGTYTFNWIYISTPIIVLITYMCSIFLSYALTKKHGWPIIIFLNFLFFFPIFYAIYKSSVLYDSWRHFFFVYPYIVILGALLIDYCLNSFISKPILQITTLVLFAVGLSLPLKWIIENSPNEYVYFNEFNGGIENALGKYDLDYYQNSGKQAAEWIKKNAQLNKGESSIIVGSNMAAIGHYFNDDTTKFKGTYVKYTKKDIEKWDYFICYSRYITIYQLTNNTWPGKDAVHVIKAGGVPIAAIYKRKTKYDYLGFEAVKKNDYALAADFYQKAFIEDPNNVPVLYFHALFMAQSGKLEEAFELLNRAKKIDAEDPGIYNTEKQIFTALGETEKARAAEQKIQDIQQANKSHAKYMVD